MRQTIRQPPLIRLLLTVLLSLVVSATVGVSAATPAQARADNLDCWAWADFPWHSSLSNRVYFNGYVQCSQYGALPTVTPMSTQGSGVNGNVQDTDGKYCWDSWVCYSDGGRTWIPYQGYGHYCTLIEGYPTVYYAELGDQQYVMDKKCIWF